MVGHLAEKQVGALWIADGQAKQAVAQPDQKAVLAETEVEPSLGQPVGNAIDDFYVGQKPNVVAERCPINPLRQAGEMAGTVQRSFIDQSHGICHASRCQ